MSSDYIWDNAKTSMTKCQLCGNRIILGEFRLIKRWFGGQFERRNYYCKKHAITKINDEIESLKQDKINIKKAMKQKNIKKTIKKKVYKFTNCVDKRGKKNEFNE